MSRNNQYDRPPTRHGRPPPPDNRKRARGQPATGGALGSLGDASRSGRPLDKNDVMHIGSDDEETTQQSTSTKRMKPSMNHQMHRQASSSSAFPSNKKHAPAAARTQQKAGRNAASNDMGPLDQAKQRQGNELPRRTAPALKNSTAAASKSSAPTLDSTILPNGKKGSIPRKPSPKAADSSLTSFGPPSRHERLAGRNSSRMSAHQKHYDLTTDDSKTESDTEAMPRKDQHVSTRHRKSSLTTRTLSIVDSGCSSESSGNSSSDSKSVSKTAMAVKNCKRSDDSELSSHASGTKPAGRKLEQPDDEPNMVGELEEIFSEAEDSQPEGRERGHEVLDVLDDDEDEVEFVDRKTRDQKIMDTVSKAGEYVFCGTNDDTEQVSSPSLMNNAWHTVTTAASSLAGAASSVLSLGKHNGRSTAPQARGAKKPSGNTITVGQSLWNGKSTDGEIKRKCAMCMGMFRCF